MQLLYGLAVFNSVQQQTRGYRPGMQQLCKVETVCTCQTQAESHSLGAQGEKKKATQILKSHD